jgi:hypothetical protein
LLKTHAKHHPYRGLAVNVVQKDSSGGSTVSEKQLDRLDPSIRMNLNDVEIRDSSARQTPITSFGETMRQGMTATTSAVSNAAASAGYSIPGTTVIGAAINGSGSSMTPGLMGTGTGGMGMSFAGMSPGGMGPMAGGLGGAPGMGGAGYGAPANANSYGINQEKGDGLTMLSNMGGGGGGAAFGNGGGGGGFFQGMGSGGGGGSGGMTGGGMAVGGAGSHFGTFGNSMMSRAMNGDASSQLMIATQEMQEMNQVFNLKYLQLQEKMQAENREYTALSNVMKAKQESAKNSLSNLK